MRTLPEDSPAAPHFPLASLTFLWFGAFLIVLLATAWIGKLLFGPPARWLALWWGAFAGGILGQALGRRMMPGWRTARYFFVAFLVCAGLWLITWSITSRFH